MLSFTSSEESALEVCIHVRKDKFSVLNCTYLCIYSQEFVWYAQNRLVMLCLHFPIFI